MSYHWRTDRTETDSNKQREQSRSFVCCRSRKVVINCNDSLLDCEMNVDMKTPFDLRHPLCLLNNRWSQKEINVSFSLPWDNCMAIPVSSSFPFCVNKMAQNNSECIHDTTLAGRSLQLVVLHQFQNKFSRKCVRLFDDGILKIPHLRSTAQCGVTLLSKDLTLSTPTANAANKKISTVKPKFQVFDNRKYCRKKKASLRSLRTSDFLEEYMSDSDIHSDDCSVEELSPCVFQEDEKYPAKFGQQTLSTMDVVDLGQQAYVGESLNSSPSRLSLTEQLPRKVDVPQTKSTPVMNVSQETSHLNELFSISSYVLDDYAETIGKNIHLKSADGIEKSCRHYFDRGGVFATSLFADTCEAFLISPLITGVQLTYSTPSKCPWLEQWGTERICHKNLITNCVSESDTRGLQNHCRQENMTLVKKTFTTPPIEHGLTNSDEDTITSCEEQSSFDSHTTVEFSLIEQDSWTLVQPTGALSAAKLQPEKEEWIVIDEFLNQHYV
ncbi:hypothetical protein P879_01073 [Paragonimus westermani]|uniref:Uncharacterized protein n=1 Tax=Paragonimus westermani TaxID=34504 RepID=A0A8T0DNF7_9TREM|nr:hypothetical protein P879_01073 [Paragonimus westermani]